MRNLGEYDFRIKERDRLFELGGAVTCSQHLQLPEVGTERAIIDKRISIPVIKVCEFSRLFAPHTEADVADRDLASGSQIAYFRTCLACLRDKCLVIGVVLLDRLAVRTGSNAERVAVRVIGVDLCHCE